MQNLKIISLKGEKHPAITTAFYVAIHFVNYGLFPGKYSHPNTVDIVIFRDFKQYFGLFDPGFTNKHKVLQGLMEYNLP